MANTANITLTGNLTRDPVAFGEGDSQVVRFTVAVNGRIRENGEWQDHTSYFQVVTFGRLAGQCRESLGKGRKVCVSGDLVIKPPREHEGRTFVDVEVGAHSVEFLSPRSDVAAEPIGGEPVGAAAGDDGLGAGWDSDIPF